jgi:hypothetical protein
MRPRRHDPARLVAACFSRHVEALDWAEQRLIGAWGPLASRSADYDFHHTTYYAAAMGTGLQKRLLVFAQSRSPACLAMAKNYAIGLENALASQRRFAEARPLNVDPGLLQLGKFALASTKDQAHRTYIGSNVYAENTLRFEAGQFVPWPWTYADYREPFVQSFLAGARADLYQQLRGVEVAP